MIETALQPRFRVLSQLKKGRCLGLDDTQVKRIMPKDLPDKTDGIEDPPIMWLIEKMIEAKKERKDSLDAMMWGYSSFDSSAPYDIFDFHVSRHRDGPNEILGGYQGHGMADCYSGNMSLVLAPGSKMTRMACWAHARRKVYEHHESDPQVSALPLALMSSSTTSNVARRTRAIRSEESCAPKNRAGSSTAWASISKVRWPRACCQRASSVGHSITYATIGKH